LTLTAAAIADDLTGALEMAALLAAHGWRTVVVLPPFAIPPEAQTVVLDTESRHLQPAGAAGRVLTAASLLRPQLDAAHVFKKIDSTLRGPIHAELQALQSVFTDRPLIVTPAYPRLGRVVKGGVLYVEGVPVHQTAFAGDPRSALANISMADAETDADLERLARSGGILAGSGGLGRIWVDGLPRGTWTAPPVHAERPLLISGSAHPVSQEQAHRARQAGIPVVAAPLDRGDPEAIESALVQQALEQIDVLRPGILIVFGGATACRLLDALGVRSLTALRELRPGIALSQIEDGPLLVTKAGGFGAPGEVQRILEACGLRRPHTGTVI
jgi:uncharacterized protein YgbK (DUF1537 family)